MRGFFLIFVSFFFFACNKADPTAYTRDPVLSDYKSQLAAATSEAESLKKELIATDKEIHEAPPQTALINLNKKKLQEIKNRLAKLEQQIRYWNIRIESRAREAQKEYLQAHSENKEWPNRQELESYFTEKRLRQAKIKWDHKDRLEQHKKSNQDSQKKKSMAH